MPRTIKLMIEIVFTIFFYLAVWGSLGSLLGLVIGVAIDYWFHVGNIGILACVSLMATSMIIWARWLEVVVVYSFEESEEEMAKRKEMVLNFLAYPLVPIIVGCVTIAAIVFQR